MFGSLKLGMELDSVVCLAYCPVLHLGWINGETGRKKSVQTPELKQNAISKENTPIGV